jgi:hypothetical protein
MSFRAKTKKRGKKEERLKKTEQMERKRKMAGKSVHQLQNREEVRQSNYFKLFYPTPSCNFRHLFSIIAIHILQLTRSHSMKNMNT